MPEIMLRIGVFRVFHQRRQQHIGIEEINTHGSVDHVGIKRRTQIGGFGLLLETDHLARPAYFDDAEARYRCRVDGQRRQRHVGAGLQMVLEHEPVIHFVNMVAGKNQYMPRLFGAYGIDVLVDRVGGSHVPISAHSLHGGQNLYEFAQFLSHNAGPAFANMTIQRKRLVLGEDVNPA